MQNAIHLEVSEGTVVSAQSSGGSVGSGGGSDTNVLLVNTSDTRSQQLQDMPSTAAPQHTHQNLTAQQLQQLMSCANSCHKNNTNNTNTNCSSPKINLMAELFESEEEEDDDNSEVLVD